MMESFTFECDPAAFEETEFQGHRFRSPEEVVMAKAKSGNWMSKVKIKHPGACTPMSKKSCTPKRAALARTFKKAAKRRKKG